jgi:Fe-S-cluster containining protein
MKKSDKEKIMKEIDCGACKTQAHCCKVGAWIDLEEAKKILSLGIKGDFFHLEIDKDFPSGFCVGTSYEDNPCTFLRPDGLCAIHKVDYRHKPQTCKDFPYEDKKPSPRVHVLCAEFKSKIKARKKQKK